MSHQPTQSVLVRAIGRWGLTALVVNTIIGSGIFGLPGVVAGLVGSASLLAYLIAAAGIGVIMACFAEVASQFREAGGPYLYARVAFGRFLGLQMGWLAWLVRLTSAAANSNLFLIYLAEFWPQAKQPLPRALVLTLLVGLLAVANIRGVRMGANLSTAFTVAKLVPLLVFIAVGLFFVHGEIPIGGSTADKAAWFKAILVLVFAYGGFEAALMPMGEAKDPRRDAPFALFAALAACTLVYTLVQIVVQGVLPDAAAASDRPLADAARQFLGPAGAALISAGALISVYGYLSGQMLSAPRLVFALAEQKDFPGVLSRLHARFRTPHVAIAFYAVLVWVLAIRGSFLWNAIISAAARLFTYGLVCAALLVLRRKQPDAAAYRLPAGAVFALLGVALALVLVSGMSRSELAVIAGTMAIAFANWLWARRGMPFK